MFFIRQTPQRVHWQPHFRKQSLMAVVAVGQEAMSGRPVRVLLLGLMRFAQVSILPELAMQM
jgi:hypothetical protein